MASIILITLELSFKLHKGHLTDRLWWKSDEATITYVMKQEYMRRYWEEIKHTYNQEFVRYIDSVLQQLDAQQQIVSASNASTGEENK